MKIDLNKKLTLIDKYQKLLSSQWTSETMEESLNLADSFLNSCEIPLGFSELFKNYEKLIDFLSSSDFKNYSKHLLLGIKKFSGIPEKIPKRRSPIKQKYSILAFQAIYNLSFPIIASYKNGKNIILDGEIGFLRDIQSLIFILASNFILPLLKQHRLKEEINYLNSTMFIHASLTWHDNPAHQFQLLSIVFDNMGFHEDVINYLYISYRLTPPEDHDYLTKAQSYWAALIDAKKFDEANFFLQKLLQNSPKKYFEEIQEIIRLTSELERHKQRKKERKKE